MRSASVALQAHIAGEVTSLCTLFRVERRDGLVLGFTDHDQDILYDGTTYEARSGYTRTAIKDSSNYSVDNLELEGLIDSDRITAEDIRAGLYDSAEIRIYTVNWADLTMGDIKNRRGTIGVVSIKDEVYISELRGLFYAFQTVIGERCSARCRSDLFDPDRCSLDPAAFIEENRASSVITDRRIFEYVGTLAAGGTTFFTLVNPGAELGNTNGWTHEVPEGTPGNWAATGATGGVSPRTGSWMFKGPPSGDVCQMSQEVDFVGAGFSAANIDTGRYTLSLKAWFNGAGGNETTQVGIRYLDWDHVEIPSFELFSPALPVPNLAWTQTIFARPVPVGARYADVIIRANDDVVAGAIVAYCDDVTAEMGDTGEVDLAESGDYYNGGLLKWTSGLNQGLSMEVKALDTVGKEIKLFLPMPFTITEHDQFEILPGCDKVIRTCRDVFDNMINFRGEPHVPGQDFLMRYPDAQ